MGHVGRGAMPRRAYGEDRPEPVLLSMATVEPEPLQWLWPGRIPAGTVSLLAGDPGLGKSPVALDIAARVTRGLPWPRVKRARALLGIIIRGVGYQGSKTWRLPWHPAPATAPQAPAAAAPRGDLIRRGEF